MTQTTTAGLNTVITSPLARRIIYGTWVIAVLIVGALGVWYTNVGQGTIPEALGAAQEVLFWLGVPVGTLAVLNVPEKPSEDALTN